MKPNNSKNYLEKVILVNSKKKIEKEQQDMKTVIKYMK